MTADGLIARRYAEALFALARERQAVDSMREELGALLELLVSASEISETLRRVDVSLSLRSIALQKALTGRVSAEVLGLLILLVEHGRGEILSAVVEEFESLSDAAQGIQRAVVSTAIELTEMERRRLLAALERLTGKRVQLRERIDPDVLAGVRVETNDRILDGSAAGRLVKMRESLLEAIGKAAGSARQYKNEVSSG